MGDVVVFLPPLEQDIREMFEQAKSGQYTFKDEDLPFVERLKHVYSRLILFT